MRKNCYKKSIAIIYTECTGEEDKLSDCCQFPHNKKLHLFYLRVCTKSLYLLSHLTSLLLPVS